MWNFFKKKPQKITTDENQPWPEDLPPLDEFARQTLEKTGIPTTLFITDPTLKPQDPTSTWVGKVIVGAPGEEWPTYEGRPMYGVCQLNLKEAPYVPDCLKEFSQICFFGIGDTKHPDHIMPSWAGDWEIRTYRPGQDLVSYENPPVPPPHWKPCSARPQVFTDYFSNIYSWLSDSHPNLSNHWRQQIEDYVDEILRPEINGAQNLPYEGEWGTKLGGWPAPVQDDIERPLAFQLGSEKDVGMYWGDQGCVYIWRTESGEWEVKATCY